MSKATEKINAVTNHIKQNKGPIIAIISIVVIVIIVITVIMFRRRKHQSLRPVFCTSPTLCKSAQTFPPDKLIPLGSVYSFSYHFFIYINNYTYQYGALKEVFSKGDKDYACPSFWLDSKINDGIFNIMTGNGMKSFRLKNIDVRRWCHIAICVREGEADLYYKGKLAYTGILGDYCKINEDSLYIGRNGGFDGLLYRLQYTPDFLTPQQVANFASKSPPINKKYFS